MSTDTGDPHYIYMIQGSDPVALVSDQNKLAYSVADALNSAATYPITQEIQPSLSNLQSTAQTKQLTSIQSGADLNSYTSNGGRYVVQGSNISGVANRPSGIVSGPALLQVYSDGSTVLQQLTEIGLYNRTFVRGATAGSGGTWTWNAWREYQLVPNQATGHVAVNASSQTATVQASWAYSYVSYRVIGQIVNVWLRVQLKSGGTYTTPIVEGLPPAAADLPLGIGMTENGKAIDFNINGSGAIRIMGGTAVPAALDFIRLNATYTKGIL